MKLRATFSFLLVSVFFLFFSSVYIVDETEQAVITQFGKIMGNPIKEPGLKFKIPFIQKALFFPKNLLQWDGNPGQIPTKEKTYIWVDTFARWKIVEPVKFLESVGGKNVADSWRRGNLRLNDIIDPAVRNFITSNRLIEAVRKSNRPLEIFDLSTKNKSEAREYFITIGRKKITDGILKQAQPKLEKFGIELVDVKIKRINYVDTVRNSVYNRMIAERKQIAEKFRSEGQGEAQKIIGQKEWDLKRITSEAYETAQKIKGKADAQASFIFAQAFGVDPEFYSFTKSLEIYKQALKKNSSLVLSTDSDFLKYLKEYSQTP